MIINIDRIFFSTENVNFRPRKWSSLGVVVVVVSPPRGVHVPRQIRIDLAIVIVLEHVVHYIASRTGQGSIKIKVWRALIWMGWDGSGGFVVWV